MSRAAHAIVATTAAALTVVAAAGAVAAQAAIAPRAVSLELARLALTVDPVGDTCAGDDATRVRCWLTARYAPAPPRDRAAALALFDGFGDVAGVERAYDMAGGYRGTIHIVPAWPTGKAGRHLGWVLAAQRDLAAFLRDLEAKSGATASFAHRGITWRFYRSVGKRTPSAYALDWTIGYNVDGSLNTSRERVLGTLVHEIFHLNDQARGGWSRAALGALVDDLVARCGTSVSCLAPYAPMSTKVRGGTYYAFQPGNGDMAGEYAAELATRYFLEQRAILRGRALPGPAWKCRTPENATAYAAYATAFFGGADLTVCPRRSGNE